jgi:hypothetical protein
MALVGDAPPGVEVLPEAVLSCILAHLDSPQDLARAEAVCCYWRRICLSSSLWLRLTARHAVGVPWDTQPILHKRLACAVFRPPDDASLIAEALAASSTDHAMESVQNTLSALTTNSDWDAPCYWSSTGSASADTSDWLLYRLCSKVCVVHAVQLQPYFAAFQAPLNGNPLRPLYSPQRCRVQLSPVEPLSPDGWADEVAVAAGCVWEHTSDAMPVANLNEMQTLTLPKPVLCFGGMLRIVLEGRVERQAADDLYYVCICRATALGVPLYGFRGGGTLGHKLLFDGLATSTDGLEDNLAGLDVDL